MILTPFGVVTSFAEAAALDIAAGLDREVDDDRSGSQRGDHRLCQQDRRLAAGNEGGADDDVGALQDLGDLFALAALEILPHLAGIAFGGFRRTGGRFVDGDKAGAKALDLLLGGGANIGRRDDGAEAPRRGDRLQPGNPRPHHQHPRRLDRAGGGHHHREGAAELVGGLERGFVAGEVGLGGKSVHRLRAGNARQQLDGERDDPGACVGLDFGRMRQRLEQADQHGTAFELAQLVAPRLLADQRALHLQDDVGSIERRRRVRRDRRSRRGKGWHR